MTDITVSIFTNVNLINASSQAVVEEIQVIHIGDVKAKTRNAISRLTEIAQERGLDEYSIKVELITERD